MILPRCERDVGLCPRLRVEPPIETDTPREAAVQDGGTFVIGVGAPVERASSPSQPLWGERLEPVMEIQIPARQMETPRDLVGRPGKCHPPALTREPTQVRQAIDLNVALGRNVEALAERDDLARQRIPLSGVHQLSQVYTAVRHGRIAAKPVEQHARPGLPSGAVQPPVQKKIRRDEGLVLMPQNPIYVAKRAELVGLNVIRLDLAGGKHRLDVVTLVDLS